MRICVFCGSRSGSRPSYLEQARVLGEAIATGGHALIYGGAGIGVMGALADAAMQGGAEVIGVMPETLVAREVAHPRLSQFHVVGTMHERKALMAEHADAFIAMPGGFGTFEEFFEVLTWAQLGIHTKPLGLLDVDGYFQPLLAMIQHAIDEGFVPRTHRDLVVVVEEPAELLTRLAAYVPPDLGRKWATVDDL